jgi:DNA-binding response OmpR family regulator
MDAMPQTTSELCLMLRDLAGILRIAADQAEHVAAAMLAAKRSEPDVTEGRLRVDPEDLTVRWNGTTCFLGYTLPFRLLERLARRPNQYVTHEQLLLEIWGGTRSKSAIRSAVNELRARLSAAGMSDLARAIDGSNAGRYALNLHGLH